ncbi:protein kinase [Ornithinibacillus salinisoli]|uniref:Protein kinase n=1 Tax=Ornithinibacillus salinisoli TaxID=1848459 RepID=A0ABW4W5A5_9BACI
MRSDINSYLNIQFNKLISRFQTDGVAIYKRLYKNIDNEKLREIFSIFHLNLNELFSFMNAKNSPGNGGHFNADPSRDLIELLKELRFFNSTLKEDFNEFSFNLVESYQQIIDRCKTFLVKSGGSTIPEDFPEINIIEHKPIFILSKSTVIPSAALSPNIELKKIGAGSYANVYKYKDPHYNKYFVVKRAKNNLREDELLRFRHEYDDLKKLDSPYIIKAYHYNNQRNEYTMEYANYSLNEFISKNNSTLSFNTRRALTIQLLNAFEYIHSKYLLHRDISYQNILVKVYDDGSSWIKVGDFGLVKRPESNLTRQGTEVKGSINDYTDLSAVGFENYSILHETYALTKVIYFILTGRKTKFNRERNDVLKSFILKGISPVKEERFKNIEEIKAELIKVVFPSIRSDNKIPV